MVSRSFVVGVACALLAQGRPAAAASREPVDTALILAVDVSNSVDDQRYLLQLEGIAAALEDPGVIATVTGGLAGAILVTLVTWSDRPKIAVPWTRVASAADARLLARQNRSLSFQGGEFTCVAGMLRFVADKLLTQVPAQASRVVIDVSGDGSENCNPQMPASAIRDEIIAQRVVINGLPILEGREGPRLADWYAANLVGGLGAFNLPAAGYADFARAIRQKFIAEIAGLPQPDGQGSASRLQQRLVAVDSGVEPLRLGQPLQR